MQRINDEDAYSEGAPSEDQAQYDMQSQEPVSRAYEAEYIPSDCEVEE